MLMAHPGCNLASGLLEKTQASINPDMRFIGTLESSKHLVILPCSHKKEEDENENAEEEEEESQANEDRFQKMET